MKPRVILISGTPGAGKTTLARPLAERLGLTLICKDDLKEAIFDAFAGPPGDLAFSNQVGAASWDVLWALARTFSTVVIEANFRPHAERERAEIEALGAEVLEVHCACPPELARRRYADRAATPERHPAHAVIALTDAHLAEYDRPLGIGRPILVDTSAAADLASLAAEVRSRLGLPPPGSDPRRAVLMTGYPASGKSTLADALARELGFGLVCKDRMLDLIFTAMGHAAGDHLASLASGRAAWAVFWTMGRAGRDVVLDSNIKPADPFEADQARALPERVVEVRCLCPREVVKRRYMERAAAFPRPAARTSTITDARLDSYDGELGLARRLTVDTSRPVDVEAIARAVRLAMGEGRWS